MNQNLTDNGGSQPYLNPKGTNRNRLLKKFPYRPPSLYHPQPRLYGFSYEKTVHFRIGGWQVHGSESFLKRQLQRSRTARTSCALTILARLLLLSRASWYPSRNGGSTELLAYAQLWMVLHEFLIVPKSSYRAVRSAQ